MKNTVKLVAFSLASAFLLAAGGCSQSKVVTLPEPVKVKDNVPTSIQPKPKPGERFCPTIITFNNASGKNEHTNFYARKQVTITRINPITKKWEATTTPTQFCNENVIVDVDCGWPIGPDGTNFKCTPK